MIRFLIGGIDRADVKSTDHLKLHLVKCILPNKMRSSFLFARITPKSQELLFVHFKLL